MLNKLERKLNGNKWPNLMVIFIIMYAAGFLLLYAAPLSVAYIWFDPALILKGQVWRLFSFMLVPDSSNILLCILTCFIFFSISKNLELILGRFKLNFFLILGWLLLVASGFLYYFLFTVILKQPELVTPVYALNPYYLYAMLFVLFAIIFPDVEFLIFFIIPIKGKWMIFITFGLYAFEILTAFLAGDASYGLILCFMVAAALLTVLIFYYLIGGKHVKVRFKRPENVIHPDKEEPPKARPESRPYHHQCVICGRTDLTNPELTFRYCSKCIGPYEYCNEHLYTHIHKTPGGNSPDA